MKNIDDLFKEELGGYTETPPPAAWGALEKKLDAAPPKGGRIAYRRIMLLALVGIVAMFSIPAIRQIPGMFHSGDEGIVSNTTGVPANTNLNTNNNSTNQQNESNITNNNTATSNSIANTDINNNDDDNSEDDDNTATNTRNKHTNKIIADNDINNHQSKNTNKKTHTGITDNEADNETDEKSQPKNVYHSNISNPAPIDESNEKPKDEAKEEVAAKPKEGQPAATEKAKTPVKMEPKKQPKPKFNLFEAGIKAGYERGFDNDAARKIVVSPYLQFNISPKFSVMLQPAIKGGEINYRSIGKSSTYYKANNDSIVIRQIDSNGVGIGTPEKLYIIKDSFAQSHDSIIKSYSIGGQYVEFEIPVTLKYYISKKLSVYGGVNVAYGELVGVQENTYTSDPITKSATYKTARRYGVDAPAPHSVNSEITYTGTPIADYKGPAYKGYTEGAWRTGYMAGFSYEFSNRLLFDALVQQVYTKSNMQAGYNVNKAMSAPYIRFTLGYKLMKK